MAVSIQPDRTQNRGEKPDGARETRWGEGGREWLREAPCSCGRPLAGERGVGGRTRGFAPQERRRNWALADDCPQARYPLLGGFRSELRRATTAGAAALSSHVSPGAAGTHVSGQTVLPAHLFPAKGCAAHTLCALPPLSSRARAPSLGEITRKDAISLLSFSSIGIP